QVGLVIAAAQEAIAAVDVADLHVGVVVLRDAEREPGELARRAVDLAAGRAPDAGLRRGLGGRDALAEQPDGARIAGAVVGGARADDVAREHALDVGAGGLVLRGLERGAEQALLLAGD